MGYSHTGHRNRSYASRHCFTSHCVFGNAIVRMKEISNRATTINRPPMRIYLKYLLGKYS